MGAKALRGPEATPREIWYDTDASIFADDRMILCGYWVPRLGMYHIPRDGVLVARGDRWIKLGGPVGLPEISISNLDLIALIHSTRVEEITHRADIVAIGWVMDVTRGSVGTGENTIDVWKVNLSVDNVLKGELARHSVEFCAQRGGFPTAEWLAPVPYFQIGETWFVFLARHDDGFWYPVDGVNGVLQVHGQELLYDGKADYPYSLLSLKRAVDGATR
jgi:hypothetical protein